MASLGMGNSYDFITKVIDEKVTKKSAGNYALGYQDNKNVFIVEYVGRSDSDVNKELKARLGSKYKKFKYSYASSAKAAYEKECTNYHDFDPPDNDIHPAKPKGTKLNCPVCES